MGEADSVETQHIIQSEPAYTIGTLVTDRERYADMRLSFESFGFDETDCEFLAVDNTGSDRISPYLGLNTILSAARGKFVILCSDYVRLVDDGRPQFESCLDELDALDPTWALCGNVGGVAPGRHSIRISDADGDDQRLGDFPAKVVSLDERFIVVRRDLRLGFSTDLDGFEFYGTDICLIAEILGLSAYAIDFHLECKAPAPADVSLFQEEKKFRDKWMRVMRSRYIQTPRRLVQIGQAGAIGLNGRLKTEAPAMIGRIAVGR
jgi:hypothetical protein